VLLNNAVQRCPAVQEGQRHIVLLLHVVVLVDDLRINVGDYVVLAWAEQLQLVLDRSSMSNRLASASSSPGSSFPLRLLPRRVVAVAEQ